MSFESDLDDFDKIINEENSSQVPVDTISRREVQQMIADLPKPSLQKCLQPGASPLDNDNRFLCWNHVGIMRAIAGKEDPNIDVMFHDNEKHSSINFKNDINYSFGSMSDDAIVVGSNGKYDNGPAMLHGINLLEANREEREWDIELPHVELIEGLAAGHGFIAVATDLRNLRLFTNGGMQSYTLTIPGQLVCMATHDHHLMIIYHNGAGHPNEQNLFMEVNYIDLINNEIRSELRQTSVALGRRALLAWAGFSDEGTPCTYDYSGMVRILKSELANHWIPVLDLRELTSSALDHYFVVGVSEMSQSVRAVKCKRSRYPELSCETSEALAFSLPLCDMDSDKGKLEEELVRLRLSEISIKRLMTFENTLSMAQSAAEVNEKLMVNNILRLFALYLKQDREEMALNLVYMIPRDFMSKLPEFAWKTNRRQYLIDALNRAIEEREQMELDMSQMN